MVCSYKNCSKEFDYKKNKKFCSRNCKQKNSQSKNKKRLKRSLDFFGKSPYKKYKKDKCEKCGFIPEHKCQLDVDHIDGNHNNNDLSNLQTLCSNCHRLKTFKNKDWLSNNFKKR